MANAADLGGDCCADLEERVAELEATTARKGNRKVSLTISGYIAQEITVWDDGKESNTYIHGLGPTQASHIKLGGQAAIAPGWKAGYLMRIQDLTGNAFSGGSTAVNQFTQHAERQPQHADVVLVPAEQGARQSERRPRRAGRQERRHVHRSLRHADHRQLHVSRRLPAVQAQNLVGRAFVSHLGQLRLLLYAARPLGGDCNGIVMNGVRYDTPTFAGFSVSASWGEDDFWEVAARYSGEVAGFKLAAGIGYTVMNDEKTSFAVPASHKDSAFFQAGAYVQHIATGLFLHGIYGNENNNDTALTSGRLEPNSNQYYVKAGIRRKVLPFGATIVYGDYARYNDQLGPDAINMGATGSALERFGGGIAQETRCGSHDGLPQVSALSGRHRRHRLAREPGRCRLC